MSVKLAGFIALALLVIASKQPLQAQPSSSVPTRIHVEWAMDLHKYAKDRGIVRDIKNVDGTIKYQIVDYLYRINKSGKLDPARFKQLTDELNASNVWGAATDLPYDSYANVVYSRLEVTVEAPGKRKKFLIGKSRQMYLISQAIARLIDELRQKHAPQYFKK